MSRKPIHLKIDMGIWQRVHFLFSGGTLHILLQPNTLGSITVKDVIVAGKSAPPREANAIPN